MSDWTIRGPSFTWPRVAERSARAGGVAGARRARRPSAGRGRPRRWRARSTGRSSSAATGWARCRRRRWCTGSARQTPSRVGPRSQTRVARPSSDSPTSSSATDAARLATCRCRSPASWSEISGVIGCRTISSLSPPMTAGTSPASEASKTGRSSRWNLRSSSSPGRCTGRAATRGPRGGDQSASTSASSALSSAADASAYRMKSTSQTLRVGRGDRVDGRDPVHGEGAGVVAAVVVRGEPAALDPDRVDDPLASWRRGCRRSRSAPSPRPRPPRAARPAPRSAWWRRSALAGRPRRRGRRLRIAVTTAATLRGSAARAALPARRGGAAGGPGAVAARDPDGAVRRPRRTGAAPSSRSRGSSTSSGMVLTSTVGASRRSPSVPAFGWCSSSVSAASSSARRNASA